MMADQHYDDLLKTVEPQALQSSGDSFEPEEALEARTFLPSTRASSHFCIKRFPFKLETYAQNRASGALVRYLPWPYACSLKEVQT